MEREEKGSEGLVPGSDPVSGLRIQLALRRVKCRLTEEEIAGEADVDEMYRNADPRTGD